MPNTIISFKKQSKNIFAFQSEFKMQLCGFTGRIIDECHNSGIVFLKSEFGTLTKKKPWLLLPHPHSSEKNKRQRLQVDGRTIYWKQQ